MIVKNRSGSRKKTKRKRRSGKEGESKRKRNKKRGESAEKMNGHDGRDNGVTAKNRARPPQIRCDRNCGWLFQTSRPFDALLLNFKPQGKCKECGERTLPLSDIKRPAAMKNTAAGGGYYGKTADLVLIRHGLTPAAGRGEGIPSFGKALTDHTQIGQRERRGKETAEKPAGKTADRTVDQTAEKAL